VEKMGMKPQRSQRTQRGFTLLELLTVMVIMFMLMGMATVGFRGVMRAGGISGAAMNVRAALRVARQYAMTHQCRTFVIFGEDGDKAWYYACAQVGTSMIDYSLGNGSHVTATRNLPWGAGELVGSEIYNILDGSKMIVSTNAGSDIWGLPPDGSSLLGGTQNKWFVGDGIGLLIREKEYLPAGIEFDGPPEDGAPMQFNHDGTATYNNGATDPFTVKLVEQNVAGAASVSVTVEGRTGRIQ